MRIAFIVSSLDNKGPIVVVRDIVKNINRNICSVVIFYFDEIQKLAFDCPTVKIDFFEKLDLSSFDIIHSHGLRPDAFLFKNRSRIRGKTVTTMHNYMQQDLTYSYNRFVATIVTPIWRYVLRSHDSIVTLSKHMAKYYEGKGLKNSKLTWVYNGRDVKPSNTPIDIADLEAINNLGKKGKILGVVGFLTRRKGIHQLINLLAVNHNLTLLIVGVGPERTALENLSFKINVHERVCFLGYRSEPEKYLQYLSIYCMTSYSEGFPLVLLEAALKKCKVVCGDTPLFRELFTEDELTFFTLDNISSLQIAVEKTLSTSGLEERLYNAVQIRYSVAKMADGYLSIYKKLLQTAPN